MFDNPARQEYNIPMIRRKRKLIELIRNYSRSHHTLLDEPTLDHDEKFHKHLDELVDYIEQVVFLPVCDDCFSAAHPERYHKDKKEGR